VVIRLTINRVDGRGDAGVIAIDRSYRLGSKLPMLLAISPSSA
jgi:hypothetical protein